MSEFHHPIPSYGKVWALGHHQADGLYNGPVVVQEKIDGSQLSFMRANDQLAMKSRSQPLDPDAPDKMFTAGIESIKERFARMPEGYIFRGEYLARPKHNTLAYERVPKGHIILFDVQKADQSTLPQYALEDIAGALGLEVVPTWSLGVVPPLTIDEVKGFLERISVLGGQTLEGIVVKNRTRVDSFGHLLKAKHVSEAFKEVHRGDWKGRNPGGKDIIGLLVGQLKTPARWEKAVERRRDAGELELDPRDIGPLLKSINEDIREEEGQYIADQLFEWAWKQIARKVTAGFAEWFKQGLVEGRWK